MIGNRRGVGLVEVIMAIAMFAIVITMLSPLMAASAKRRNLATAETYRWALTAESINRVAAMPAAVLTAGTVCDTAAALPIQFSRCVTITNVSNRLQTIQVIVLPVNQSWIPGDTVTLNKASNVGPLDITP